MDIEIHGHEFILLAGCGLYWPAERTLFIADPHFGKEATFRRHGIGVPVGSTDGTLATIGEMLDATAAIRVIILGDMFHARSSLSTEVCRSIESFLEVYETVEFLLVRGNHDEHVGALPPEWPIETVSPGSTLGRITLTHHPSDVPEASDLVLCGHIHPAIRVHGVGKLPCFWLCKGCLVLPAIGEFTGTHVITAADGDRVWIVADDEVIEHRPCHANNLEKTSTLSGDRK